MARRKSKTDKQGMGMFLAMGLLAALLFVAPALLLVTWGILRMRISKFRSNSTVKLGNPATFWLDDKEKRIFKFSCEKIVECQNKISMLEQQGEEEGIPRNKDDSFSARSKRGKELGNAIAALRADQSEYYKAMNHLSTKPYRRWKHYTSLFAKEKAAFLACVTFILSGVYLGAISGGAVTDIFINYFRLPYDWFKGNPTDFVFPAKMIGATIITFGASYLGFASYFKLTTPVPLVDYKNVDQM